MQVNGKVFAEALTKVLRVKTKKSALDILESIHVTVQDNKCTLMCTDLEAVVITTIPTISSKAEEGMFIMPPRAYMMLAQLKDIAVINIIAEPAGKVHVINISHDLGKLKTIGENPDNYPLIQQRETTVTFKQITKDFYKLLNTSKKFLSNDDMRPAMTGVLMTNKHIVATDAHRLIEAKYETGVKEEFKAIVPGIFITAFAGIEDAAVTISISDDQIIAQDNYTTIISRLIDARYPDYKVVIPTDSLYDVTVTRKPFLANLKLAMMCTDMESKSVRLTFGNTGYKMTAYDKELTDEVILNGDCEIIKDETSIGTEFNIAFNGNFLQQMLELIADDEVTFEMTEGSRCTLFHTETMTLLLMPLKFPTGEEVEEARAAREEKKSPAAPEPEPVEEETEEDQDSEPETALVVAMSERIN